MTQTEIRLPQWGMGMREGTIVAWLKQAGDLVTEGDPLAEIEADKVADVVLAPVTGTLVETRFPEDSTVAVRTVIAVMRSP
jgi:pyruvate/2-oxoglutarate dehydrogenase complex dihydrolipoamide acyltransferase (E2) component